MAKNNDCTFEFGSRTFSVSPAFGVLLVTVPWCVGVINIVWGAVELLGG